MNETKSFSIHCAVESIPCNEERERVKGRLHDLDCLLRSRSPFYMRDDSRLAFLAAKGGTLPPLWNDEVVVHECAIQQWLCQTSIYVSLLPLLMKKVANRLKGTHKRLPWNCVWEIVKRYVPDILKYEIISHVGQVPNFYPLGYVQEIGAAEAAASSEQAMQEAAA